MRALAVRSRLLFMLAAPMAPALTFPGAPGSAAVAAEQEAPNPAAAEAQIRAVIAESAEAYASPECKETKPDFMPDEPPYVHFSAEDRVITLATLDEVNGYCQRIKQGRVAAEEEIQEQRVHMLTQDSAYVVTRSTQKTRWQGGRTQVLPTVETSIVVHKDGRWQIVYRHISWSDAPPAR